jgi:hypothetical protein
LAVRRHVDLSIYNIRTQKVTILIIKLSKIKDLYWKPIVVIPTRLAPDRRKWEPKKILKIWMPVFAFPAARQAGQAVKILVFHFAI